RSYRPDNTMTYQALSALAGMGVDMHDVAVKLTPKGKMDLDGSNPDGHFLHASARELMAYGGDPDAEARMRFGRQRRSELIPSAKAFLKPVGVADPRAPRDDAFLRSLKADLARVQLFSGQY